MTATEETTIVLSSKCQHCGDKIDAWPDEPWIDTDGDDQCPARDVSADGHEPNGEPRQTRLAAHHDGQPYGVVTASGGRGTYRRTPCAQCPWVVENAGTFPAEAFVLSAPTSYDHAISTFGCHMTPQEHASTCAGFLLRNAENNLAMRINQIEGRVDFDKVSSDGRPLWDSYRDMAVGNGVSPDDPALAPCVPDSRHPDDERTT